MHVTIVGRIYRVVRPRRHAQPSDIRVLDEFGEDYLDPRHWFVHVRRPSKAKRAPATS